MASTTRQTLKVALAGNPNSGKTTLFNTLTGAHHKVGNYPGVTVERREGTRTRGQREYRFVDLPGIYSLTAYSMDEVVARDFLLDEKPDVIVDVLDSTNLERHLYLCLQFQELGIPVVGALNMSDEAEAKGITVDGLALSTVLGLPMVKTVGPRGSGVDELLDAIDAVVDGRLVSDRFIQYGDEVESRLAGLDAMIRSDEAFAARFPSRWLAVKLLEKDANAMNRLSAHTQAGIIQTEALAATAWLEKHYGKDAEIVVSEQRYGYIRGAVKENVKIVRNSAFTVTESIDRVVMNPFLALPIFGVVLWSVFQITFLLGEYPMAWLEGLFGFVTVVIESSMPDGLLRSLLVDGMIGGVGGVLSFVPLIVILFFLLSILEDLGYMSRAAFATDKLLHSFGLHGQSIFPMMLGFGCSVPAIMAARTLKSPRDRIITILVIPFMSCGAKLPVYVLLSAAFFPDNAANMVMLVYITGVVLALLSALLLKNTILRGDPTPFVMELPPYRAPTARGVIWHVWDKSWQYIKKAGTVILAASVLIWAVTTFPVWEPSDAELENLAATWDAGIAAPGLAGGGSGSNGQADGPADGQADGPADGQADGPEVGQADGQAREAWLQTATAEAAMAYSVAGRLGKFIEPVVRPLGFDWKVGVATVTGFAAKEVVVSTLGILYRVGTEETEESESLRDALRKDPTWNPLVAFVLMLFMLIIPPCFASLATIRAELGWKWLGFSFAYLLTVGWLVGFAVYQIGSLVIAFGVPV